MIRGYEGTSKELRVKSKNESREVLIKNVADHDYEAPPARLADARALRKSKEVG